MSDLIVSDEQARILTETSGLIFIRDRNGKVLGRAFPESQASTGSTLTADQIARAEQRLDSDGPWYTTQQVRERLRSTQPKSTET